jgi:hypothetical protein
MLKLSMGAGFVWFCILVVKSVSLTAAPPASKSKRFSQISRDAPEPGAAAAATAAAAAAAACVVYTAILNSWGTAAADRASRVKSNFLCGFAELKFQGCWGDLWGCYNTGVTQGCRFTESWNCCSMSPFFKHHESSHTRGGERERQLLGLENRFLLDSSSTHKQNGHMSRM